MTDHPILFIPGPVEVEAELRAIMATPLVGHRSKPFMATAKELSANLQKLFLSSGPGFFDNCPATAIMEAGIRNLVERRVLHLTCGAFGERWAKISKACGREPESISVEWGEAVSVDQLRTKLAESEPFEAVCITHCETSTGLVSPLAEMAAVIRELSPETLILVDAVTTLAGAELRFEDWGLDLAFAGTQKCLALPPGLAVYAVSERAIERSQGMAGKGFLLDFAAAPERFGAGATPATPCVPLVYALVEQLKRIRKEGLENRW
ncbi:MAG: pyridoxal-phosphate-dependent aminotransferase family protein, partial [Planctomycetota bacterium]